MSVHPRHAERIALLRQLSWTANAIVNRSIDVLRHGSHTPSASRLILVDPKAINGRADLPRRPSWKRLGTVLSGDWDLHRLDLKAGAQSSLEYFQADRTQTARDRLRQQLIDRGKDAEVRIQRCDALYESIKSQGFQPFMYGGNRLASLLPLGIRGFTPNGVSAIDVAVARNGDLLWVGSNHRMAISLALELNHVPALVRWVHADWNGTLKTCVT